MNENLNVTENINRIVQNAGVIALQYNSFKIDYLNGTMINQNFLNVGDKIKFSFNNNPIRYDNINLKANFITTNYGTGRTDSKDYKYLTLDLFKEKD